MTRTRQQLLENFDTEVHEKLRINLENSRTYLNRYEQMLLALTRYELRDHAEFVGSAAFRLTSCPFSNDIPLGLYELPRRSDEAHIYRLGHPLAEHLISQGKSRELPIAEIVFDYAAHDARIAILESLLGETGWLQVTSVSITALDQVEDHLLFTAIMDGAVMLDSDQARRLLSLPATVSVLPLSATPLPQLSAQRVSGDYKDYWNDATVCSPEVSAYSSAFYRM
jgi:adenine-specific DNA-methyltransferase